MVAILIRNMLKNNVQTSSYQETVELGRNIGAYLKGGEVIELRSDLGGGKTTLVSGLVQGFGSPDPVSSPSFTINYVYSRPDKKQLYHFDFYRLTDAGVVANELAEVEGDTDVVVVVEWGEIVHSVLPGVRIIVTISVISENERKLTFEYDDTFAYLFTNLKQV